MSTTKQKTFDIYSYIDVKGLQMKKTYILMNVDKNLNLTLKQWEEEIKKLGLKI